MTIQCKLPYCPLLARFVIVYQLLQRTSVDCVIQIKMTTAVWISLNSHGSLSKKKEEWKTHPLYKKSTLEKALEIARNGYTVIQEQESKWNGLYGNDSGYTGMIVTRRLNYVLKREQRTINSLSKALAMYNVCTFDEIDDVLYHVRMRNNMLEVAAGTMASIN